MGVCYNAYFNHFCIGVIMKITFKEHILPGGIVIDICDYDTPSLTVIDLIRKEAKAQRWSGISGIKEYCKEEYNAILRYSTITERYTSLVFKDRSQFDKLINRMGNNL